MQKAEYHFEFIRVDPRTIINDEFQPRSTFSDEKLEELKLSIIQTQGNIEPVTLMKREDDLVTIAGHRRVIVCVDADLLVNARVIDEIPDEDAWALAIATNVKEDMTIGDLIRSIHKLVEYDLSLNDIHEKIGMSKTQVQRMVSVPRGNTFITLLDEEN